MGAGGWAENRNKEATEYCYRKEMGDDMRSKKILVVDDDQDACWLLSQILEEERYRVTTSMEGNGAIRIAKKEKPDLVLLDLEMRGINGVEILRRLRRFNKDVPVILISASENERLINEALELGIFAHIPKMFKLEELLLTVKKAMKRREIFDTIQSHTPSTA